MGDFLKPYTLAAYAAAVLLIIGGVLLYGHSKYTSGYNTAKAEALEQVAKERSEEFTRQSEANVAAQTSALEDLTRLSMENASLKQTLQENARAAAQDADAARACLGADSVRRLNQVR